LKPNREIKITFDFLANVQNKLHWAILNILLRGNDGKRGIPFTLRFRRLGEPIGRLTGEAKPENRFLIIFASEKRQLLISKRKKT